MAQLDDNASPVLEGMLTRDQLRQTDPFRGKSVRAIQRMEAAGLPVIRRGMLRLYDVNAVRAWLRGERPTRGRAA